MYNSMNAMGTKLCFFDDVYAYSLKTVRVKRSFLATHVTHAQTCNVTCVLSAAEWTASVHTLHMSKHVMLPVF